MNFMFEYKCMHLFSKTKRIFKYKCMYVNRLMRGDTVVPSLSELP